MLLTTVYLRLTIVNTTVLSTHPLGARCKVLCQSYTQNGMSKLHTKVVPAQHNTRHEANVRQTDERWKK